MGRPGSQLKIRCPALQTGCGGGPRHRRGGNRKTREEKKDMGRAGEEANEGGEDLRILNSSQRGGPLYFRSASFRGKETERIQNLKFQIMHIRHFGLLHVTSSVNKPLCKHCVAFIYFCYCPLIFFFFQNSVCCFCKHMVTTWRSEAPCLLQTKGGGWDGEGKKGGGVG